MKKYIVWQDIGVEEIVFVAMFKNKSRAILLSKNLNSGNSKINNYFVQEIKVIFETK